VALSAPEARTAADIRRSCRNKIRIESPFTESHGFVLAMDAV